MNKQSPAEKSIFVHIGPHKTGSTAIQRCFAANQAFLQRAGLHYLHSSATHDTAKFLAAEAFDKAEAHLGLLSRQISGSEAQTILLSQEDFCGDLPGRSRKRAIYPKLTKNLRTIARMLLPHHVKFVFFQRDADQWLESCYHQHLKHRTHFSTFETFRTHFDNFQSWNQTLEKPKTTFGDSLVIVPYQAAPDAGVTALLNVVGLGHINLPHSPQVNNASPAPEKIRLLERINELSSFRSTAWFSKALVLRDWTPRPPDVVPSPPSTTSDIPASIALPHLVRRAQSRISPQEIDDILPDWAADLDDYIFRRLPINAELPDMPRANIRDQSRILDYHLRGKSQLAKLNALTISYLRRDTKHTPKARHLFHRVWEEYGRVLINELSTRWLISTLQTFLDHGRNEAQRNIGTCGYFYANMIKIYEGERAIDGLPQDGLHPETTPQTSNKFDGLDRYVLGGTDLLLNTNALALDLAMRDDVAGLVLQEFLLRVRQSANVFTRVDRTRKAKDINIAGFTDTWSFFVPPE